MKYIIGNWKMFPTSLSEAEKIFSGIRETAHKTKRAKVTICAPFVYLPQLIKMKGKARISVGAQNAYLEEEGAFTGEVSPKMVKSFGVSHVIIGHSERRAMGEGSDMVAKKSVLAIKNGLHVVLCVGEKTRDESGAYFAEVRHELEESLRGIAKSKYPSLIIAYEPIWAIGKHAVRPATTKDLEEMVIHIRRTLVSVFGKKNAFTVPILYGGSVDEKNAGGFLREGKADGLLVGRISLDVKKFSAIIRDADTLK